MPIRSPETFIWLSFPVQIPATSPFYFSRGGVIDLNTGSQRAMGVNGSYWSSTASTASYNAYLLDFNTASTYSSNSNGRWLGFSVR